MMTQRLHKRNKKAKYSEQNQHKQKYDKQNNNNCRKNMGIKLLYEYIKWLTGEISSEKRWALLRKGNLKRNLFSM